MAQEEIEGRILENAREAYDLLEQELSPETMRAVERQVMLRVVDANWVQHLTAMENLRQGIGLHAYGQRDPLVMYKTEGHAKFQDLQTGIQHDIVHNHLPHRSLTERQRQVARWWEGKASQRRR